jgi:hypothetical protein
MPNAANNAQPMCRHSASAPATFMPRQGIITKTCPTTPRHNHARFISAPFSQKTSAMTIELDFLKTPPTILTIIATT